MATPRANSPTPLDLLPLLSRFADGVVHASSRGHCNDTEDGLG